MFWVAEQEPGHDDRAEEADQRAVTRWVVVDGDRTAVIGLLGRARTPRAPVAGEVREIRPDIPLSSGGGIIPDMIDKVGVVVPACEPRYSSNVLGGDYLPAVEDDGTQVIKPRRLQG